MKNEVTQVFNDLDGYKKFCVMFGRPFNEAALYNEEDQNYFDYIASKNRRHNGRIENGWKRDIHTDKRKQQ